MMNGQAIIFGAGRVGTTFACMLKASGIAVNAIGSRDYRQALTAVQFVGEGNAFEWNPFCETFSSHVKQIFEELGAASQHHISLLLLTTPDDILLQAAEMLASLRSRWNHIIVFHCSAGLGREVLKPFASKGGQTAILHPSYPISRPAKSLPDNRSVVYSFVGETSLHDFFSKLVASWGGIFLDATNFNRTLYHAGNVLASGHVTALLASAQNVLTQAGVSTEDTIHVISSLLQGVLHNVQETAEQRKALKDSITGPFVRGDVQMIERHCQALREHAPEVEEMYKILGALWYVKK